MLKGPLIDALEDASPELAGELSGVYNAALEIWKEPYLSKYTEHGRPHFEQVARNLDSLTAPLQSSNNPLSPEEIYVLLAACCLHDIGMQQDLPDARAEHAQYAYDLILHSHALVGGVERKITLNIQDTNAREAIALVARAHWTSYALKLGNEQFIRDDNSKGRLRLLGTLLAMADLLDLSPIRAKHFRSQHSLLKLDALGELHQGMHRIVRGLEIVPANSKLPSDLQFKLSWRQDDQVTRDISEWVLTSFSYQWRQLSPELKFLSNGAIRWHTPWVEATFEPLPGSPLHKFSASALDHLKAEKAEQERINRDHFAKALREGVQNRSRTLFLLQGSSNSDVKELLHWTLAQAKILGDGLAARLDLRSGDPLGLTSAIAQLTEQWGLHLKRTEDDDEAMDVLKMQLHNDLGQIRVSVISMAPSEVWILERLLDALFDLPEDRGHICVVAGLDALAPRLPKDIECRRFSLEPFTKREVKKHLTEKLGYAAERAGSLYNKMEKTTGVLDCPTVTYEYARAHFGFAEA